MSLGWLQIGQSNFRCPGIVSVSLLFLSAISGARSKTNITHSTRCSILLPLATPHYPFLPLATLGYPSLPLAIPTVIPLAIFRYFSLPLAIPAVIPLTTLCYLSLSLATHRYSLLPLATPCYLSLSLTTLGYPLLSLCHPSRYPSLSLLSSLSLLFATLATPHYPPLSLTTPRYPPLSLTTPRYLKQRGKISQKPTFSLKFQ